MVKLGYKLMSEEHGPRALVENACRAEDAGFDFVGLSDHFLPWLSSQGHSPFAWSVLGAIAAGTDRIEIATGLTCPLIRYHPAVIAQASATVAVMSQGRFTLALGAGERLNEHVVGQGWPGIAERHERLKEAIDIIRLLWQGDRCDYEGLYYTIDQAKLYDVPDEPIDIVVGISGEKSAALAADAADGIMATSPEAALIEMWQEAGGGAGPRYAEVALGYGPDREAAIALAHDRFRFSTLGWPVLAELPTESGFEAATKLIRKEDVAAEIPCGPDLEAHVRAVKAYADAGFDHIALLGIGPDQAGFIRFFESELRPALERALPH